jgi:hypothetical protein
LYSHVHRTHHFLTGYGKLHLIAVCFNPMRFLTRYTLFEEFVKRAVAAGAEVYVVEAAFGERPFECMDHGQVATWQFRSNHEIWNKEAMINASVARLPHDWKYVAWVDADVAFTNPHWVQETIQQLQHHCVVQMFHTATDLDATDMPTETFKGFPATYLENPAQPDARDSGYYYYYLEKGKKQGFWHPGYAWAARREAWNAMGGLLDINIVGGGDHQMANAYYGRADKAIPFKSTPSYRNAVMAWQSHARSLNRDVGFVPGALLHYWHGSKQRRGYFDRWQILARNKFDPRTDLRRDWQGLWQLAGNKPQLRDDLRAYFRARQEDGLQHG